MSDPKKYIYDLPENSANQVTGQDELITQQGALTYRVKLNNLLNGPAQPPANLGTVQASEVTASGTVTANQVTANQYGTVNATTVSTDTANITDENVENLNATNLNVASNANITGNVTAQGNLATSADVQANKITGIGGNGATKSKFEFSSLQSSFTQSEFQGVRCLLAQAEGNAGPVFDAYQIDGNSNSLQFNGDNQGQFLKVYGVLEWKLGGVKIKHPVDPNNRWLRLSSTHSPQAEVILRGQVTLSGGQATVDLDTEHNFTANTFTTLCTDPQVFVSNATGWTAVRGTVSGSTLTVEAQDAQSTDTVSWMVVARRQDADVTNAYYTNASGVIDAEQEIPTTNNFPANNDVRP